MTCSFKALSKTCLTKRAVWRLLSKKRFLVQHNLRRRVHMSKWRVQTRRWTLWWRCRAHKWKYPPKPAIKQCLRLRSHLLCLRISTSAQKLVKSMLLKKRRSSNKSHRSQFLYKLNSARRQTRLQRLGEQNRHLHLLVETNQSKICRRKDLWLHSQVPDRMILRWKSNLQLKMLLKNQNLLK